MSHSFKFVFILIFFSQIIFSQTKSPAAFLGYELGDRFSRHDQVLDYFEHVANNNGNVKLVNYGKTYENRRLELAIIASPDNFNKLEEIKANQCNICKQICTKSGKPVQHQCKSVHILVLLSSSARVRETACTS